MQFFIFNNDAYMLPVELFDDYEDNRSNFYVRGKKLKVVWEPLPIW